MKVKLLILVLVVFGAGFLTHALLFPDFLANGISDVSQIALPKPIPTNQQAAPDPLVTKVDFDSTHFSRHNITVRFSRYIQITNTNKESLMSLASNNPLLTTPRGYGYLEAVQTRMDKKGQFV